MLKGERKKSNRFSLGMKKKSPADCPRGSLQRRRDLSSGDLFLAFQRVKKLIMERGYQLGLEIPQTTSLLERDIKEFRRRVRPMDGFFSDEGARNFSAYG